MMFVILLKINPATKTIESQTALLTEPDLFVFNRLDKKSKY